MKVKANTPTRILQSDLVRTRAYITLLTDATVYLLKKRPIDIEGFLDNGFPLRIYGVHELEGYNGEIWAVSDTNATDIRVIDY